MQGIFDATSTLSDVQAPESAGITVNGQGAPGFVNGTGQLRLEEAGEGSILHYEGDAHIGGRLAAVGQRLLDASTKAIIGTGLEGLDAQVAAGRPVTADATASGQAPTPSEPPSHLAFAVGVVRNMISDALGGTGRTALVRKAVLAASLILIIYGLWLWIGKRRVKR